MRILVVYWWPEGQAMRAAVEQHLRALDHGSDDVVYLNAATGSPSHRHRRERCDGVVLHTTFLCLRWDRAFPRHRRAWSWLGGLDCPKVALPQDEYDHAAVLDEWLEELAVDTVYSCFDEPTRAPIYLRMSTRARFAFGLTGYLDGDAAAYFAERARPAEERPYDIVYRALQLPYWFGSHGQLKHRIGAAVEERASAHGLRTDISTRPEDTILGAGWLDFVMSGRGIVGAESGSSALDAHGEIQRRIRELLAVDPSMTVEEVDRHMPAGWDSYAFFAISPRHFEAVLARTCQILVEGSYSGVLEPGRHYIPVQRDLSDLDDALERLSDRDFAREITDRAYEEIYLNGVWTTDDFAARLRESLCERRSPAPRRRLPAWRRLDPRPLPLPRAQLRHLADGGRMAVPALRSLWDRPALARLIAQALPTAPGRVTLARALARDLVRLGVLDRFERHQIAMGGPWRVGATAANEELVLVSDRKGDRHAPPLGRVRAIVWDHSRFGRTAPLDPHAPSELPVGLGGHGRYRFEGLSRLVAVRPDLPWAKALTGRR